MCFDSRLLPSAKCSLMWWMKHFACVFSDVVNMNHKLFLSRTEIIQFITILIWILIGLLRIIYYRIFYFSSTVICFRCSVQHEKSLLTCIRVCFTVHAIESSPPQKPLFQHDDWHSSGNTSHHRTNTCTLHTQPHIHSILANRRFTCTRIRSCVCIGCEDTIT